MTNERPDWTQVIRTCGPELPEWIRHDVRALGGAAAAPLLEILRTADPSLDEGAAANDPALHALHLLAEAPADETVIAHCLRVIHEDPDRPLASAIAWLLPRVGPGVAPAALAAYGRVRDGRGDEAAHLVEILARCGARDPRIYAALLNALRRFPARVAGLLGHYGDPRAIGPLAALIDAAKPSKEDDDTFSSSAVIGAGASIGMLGGELTEAQARLVELETRFEEYVLGEDADEPQVPDEAPPRPAANAPCWCGSGRKYKKCHQAEDDAAGG